MMTHASLFLFYSNLALLGHGVDVSAAADALEPFEMLSPRNLSFFGLFASEQNRHKVDGRLDCVFGDPIKGRMCPPVMKDPMAHLKQDAEDENVLETFSRCLDDPDSPECRELVQGDVSPATQVAQAPANLRNLFGATVSPTTDDWYVCRVGVGILAMF